LARCNQPLPYPLECECAALAAKAHLFSALALTGRDWMVAIVKLPKLER
jgi:hypothetical protein